MVTLERIDFSPVRTSCVASTEEGRGFGAPHTYLDYKVVDVLSEEVLFEDTCNNNEPKAHNFCGDGKNMLMRAERDKAFDDALERKKYE